MVLPAAQPAAGHARGRRPPDPGVQPDPVQGRQRTQRRGPELRRRPAHRRGGPGRGRPRDPRRQAAARHPAASPRYLWSPAPSSCSSSVTTAVRSRPRPTGNRFPPPSPRGSSSPRSTTPSRRCTATTPQPSPCVSTRTGRCSSKRRWTGNCRRWVSSTGWTTSGCGRRTTCGFEIDWDRLKEQLDSQFKADTRSSPATSPRRGQARRGPGDRRPGRHVRARGRGQQGGHRQPGPRGGRGLRHDHRRVLHRRDRPHQGTGGRLGQGDQVVRRTCHRRPPRPRVCCRTSRTTPPTTAARTRSGSTSTCASASRSCARSTRRAT